MQALTNPRVTPWVLRLGLVNLGVLLLLETLFISPGLFSALAFDPRHALERPWTFVTYMFVHGSLLHFLMNMLFLWLFGSQLEARLNDDGRAPLRFVAFYLFCGIGAAAAALVISGFTPVAPFVGASGAVLGIVVGLAMAAPDSDALGDISARTVAVWVVGFNVVMLLPFLRAGSGIAYEAHLGGALAGYLYFRMQQLRPQVVTPPRRPAQRPVMVQPGAAEMERPEGATPAAPPRTAAQVETDPVSREIDRVLDKISAQGMASLTSDERRFLDEVARKKRGQNERA